MFEIYIYGCLTGVIVSGIIHSYIFRGVDPWKVELIEGYYEKDE